KVLLSALHRCREYKLMNDHQVAKFMPCFNSPYKIHYTHPESSAYMLDLPTQPHVFLTFHTSLLCHFQPNDPIKYPEWEQTHPGPIVTADSTEESFVDKIIDECCHGHGFQYLVQWVGKEPEGDLWLP
ncbi:hypothetical protein FISHEDRAFT_21116, partial [Fistulina hepatica ATCC 64428]